jgi:hypothetical protein
MTATPESPTADASKRGALALAVARLVWGGATGSTPRPNDEAAAHAFLCSPQAKDKLTNMLVVADAAAAEHLAKAEGGGSEGVAAAQRAARAKKVADAAAAAAKKVADAAAAAAKKVADAAAAAAKRAAAAEAKRAAAAGPRRRRRPSVLLRRQ